MSTSNMMSHMTCSDGRLKNSFRKCNPKKRIVHVSKGVYVQLAIVALPAHKLFAWSLHFARIIKKHVFYDVRHKQPQIIYGFFV